MWANNEVGAGEISLISTRTIPPTEEKGELNFLNYSALSTHNLIILDLILRIMEDAQNFDTRIWILAVGVGMYNQIYLLLSLRKKN
jgi:hypothetical protein